MPESDPQSDSALSLQERKQLLILACEVDRSAWCESCRPRPSPPMARVAELLCCVTPLLTLLPGLSQRWSKRFAFLTRIARQFASFVA